MTFIPQFCEFILDVLNYLPKPDNYVTVDTMSRRPTTDRFSVGEEMTLTAFLVLFLAGLLGGILYLTVQVHWAFILFIPGPPLLWVFFIAGRALIREGIKEIRYRLSDWHERQNPPKDGPYR